MIEYPQIQLRASLPIPLRKHLKRCLQSEIAIAMEMKITMVTDHPHRHHLYHGTQRVIQLLKMKKMLLLTVRFLIHQTLPATHC